MTTPLTSSLETWATSTTVTLQRGVLERAVRALDKLEALALIRAAYDCGLREAKVIYVVVMETT